ncbi:type VI secretion system membrane subunit TssM [Affinibrenneria salicis]|uniref:Type VI secretion system membrane subunit TssM n=1 Tax=Affinibrenneria salicis TaxID=2590031 RepID=A0A5J5FWV6_9GAMM|nr:type VI secretion system membrane subunit TssM [Affinibrenneria salicis]KAA8998156.1 type VI secretion system membrane subunit TssM [Affinibrenneria salicis]
MLNSLLSIITSRLLWGFVGITALSFVIWTIGPMIAIGDYRPLESESNRLIAILVLSLIWILSRVIPHLYRAWRNSKMLSHLRESAAVDETESSAASHDDGLLAERFSEAAQLLKKAQFSDARNGQSSWWSRFNRQYLYQLPWYVIIGAPGAGKTTALVNSGLHFPLADRFGKSALRGVGGTRNCDWWFTNEAVLLDTAGRYTTQESQQEQDTAEWQSFVGLLKKYRARQPINGTIITISIADLLTETPEALQQQARALRKRLLELHEQLGIHFPVYVMVTKADLIKGFSAYFTDLDKAQRDQVWGLGFPWQQSRQADFDLTASFEQQYTALQQRLENGLPETLIREQDPIQRADSYLFPQEFAALRPLLSQYLETVFAKSGFETQFSPRGVYFTSGTQEGLPFDRVMGALNRALQLPTLSERTENGNWDTLDKKNPIPAGKGQSYFLKELLENVIFQESGLAGSNRWWEYRNRALQWTGYIVLAAVLLIVGLAWFTSFYNNKSYLADVQTRLPQLEQQAQALKTVNSGDMLTILPYLNAVQTLPESRDFSPADPPFSYRMGLYRGDQIADATRSLYQKTLKELLLPQVAQQIATTLRNDNGIDADFSYEALKAYQMLYQPKHYDGKFLRAWVMLNLQKNQSASITQNQLRQLERHLSQLLDNQIQTSPYARDDELIARQQALIGKASLPQRVYGRIRRLLSQDERLATVSVVSLAGPQTELAFSRKSGKPLTDGIPGLYTPDGYWQVFDKNIDGVASTLREEDRWVLNTPAAEQNAQEMDLAVRLLYMADYIRQWDGLLADIQLNNTSDLNQRISNVRLLSGSTSPMRLLIINVGKNVTLTKEEEKDGKEKAINAADLNSNTSRTLQTLFSNRQNAAQPTPQTPEQVVTDHFAPIIELAQPAGENSKSIPFDEVLQQVDELYSYLTAVQGAANSGMPAPAGNIIPRLQADAGRLPMPFRDMLSTVAVGASSDTQRRDMENMRKRISVEVGSFCRQAIAGRYPLTPGARTEVTPDDLARMFAPGSGLMDSFFRENLSGKVDTTHASWRFTPGVDGKSLPGGEALLRPFQQAQSIRDAFFANGATTPSFRATLRPVSMDTDILNMTLDVDGQLMRYSHGPQNTQVVSWPGSGGTNQVRLQLDLNNGTSSSLVTSGPWALNRFLDRARQSAGSGNMSRVATFSVDGHQVTLEFTPNSIRNPFRLPGFSCP